MQDGDMKYRDFCEAVDAGGARYGERRISRVLYALQKRPYALPNDRRTLRYSREWVLEVRKVLEEEDAGIR